jgi:Putative effector of murein hydrolase
MSALTALGLSVLTYLAGLWIQRRTGNKPYMHPVVLAMLLVVLALAWLGEPYTEDYLRHNAIMLDLLMVAVVAFAVPLVDNLRLVLRDLARLTAVVLLAAVFIAGSTVALCLAAGIDREAIAAFSFRSVTNPIAIAIAEQNRVSVDIAMFGVFVTGLVGVLTAEPLLRAVRITDPAPRRTGARHHQSRLRHRAGAGIQFARCRLRHHGHDPHRAAVRLRGALVAALPAALAPSPCAAAISRAP